MNHKTQVISVALLAVALAQAALCGPAHSSAATSPAWWSTSYLNDGGYWSVRIRVHVHSDNTVQGAPCTIVVGEGAGQLPLAGEPAGSVRVVDDAGNELLYDIETPDGSPRRDGFLAAGDTFTVPVTCAAGDDTDLFVYADNGRAWPVPDFLPPSTAHLRNGNFEKGSANQPDDWDAMDADGIHSLSYDATVAHSGSHSVKATAPPGAAASWFSYSAENLAATVGDRYEFHAWVRAQDVVGQAGWYLHVNGSKDMVYNHVIDGGSGTYDWKEVTATFDVPADGQSISLGTVLYGTGTAWYDDAALTLVSSGQLAPQGIVLTPGPVETCPLHGESTGGTVTAWPSAVHAAVGFTIDVCNYGPATGFVQTDIRRNLLVSRLGPHPYVTVYRDGHLLPSDVTDGMLTIKDSIPALWRGTYTAYLGRTSVLSPPLGHNPLLAASRNLVENPTFDAGDVHPTGWAVSAEDAKANAVATAERTPGGKTGNWCVKVTIPDTVTPGWFGLHQRIAAEPGQRYVYGAWVRTRGEDGPVSLYAHLLDAAGNLVKSDPYLGGQPSVTSAHDWVWLQLSITTPADCRFIELHLTDNVHGTIWYDGVVLRHLAPALTGMAGTLAQAPASRPMSLNVWQMPTTIKVFRDDPSGPQLAAIDLKLAKNERQPVQVVLRSNTVEPHVGIAVSALRDGSGHSLPAPSIGVVGYVPVDYPSNYYRADVPAWQRKIPTAEPASDGWPGLWPDPLPDLKDWPSHLAPGEDQPIWITVHAPADAATGVYHGAVTITTGGAADVIPFHVTVRDFALPKRPSIAITYDMHNLDGEVGRTWFKFMAEHRASGGYLPEPTQTIDNGVVTLDFTAFDRMASYVFDDLDIATIYTPMYFYALGWEYSPKDFMGFTAFTPEWKNAFDSSLRQYIDHVKAKGWYDRINFYLSDEPHATVGHVADDLKKYSAEIQSIDPKIPIYSSTWEHFPVLDGVVTRWGAGQYGDFPVDQIKARQAAGDRFWFTTDGQQVLDTPYLGTERLFSWYCFKYGIEGFEFWGVNWWKYDVWKYGWHPFISQSELQTSTPYWVRYPDGDGYLTYPSPEKGPDVPVTSIRWESVRDGEQDYEYLAILRDRIAAARRAGRPVAAAEAVMQRALTLVSIPNTGGDKTTKLLNDPTDILRFRDMVGNAIEKLGR